MSRQAGLSWGIAARLLAIAVLPAIVMFLAVTLTLYAVVQADVRRDVAERGRLMATALAQSSQYGLMSGNVGYLRTTVRQLLEADPSMACIDIMDAAWHSVASDCVAHKPTDTDQMEEPVRVESLTGVDLFDPATGPQASTLRTIGHVRITISPAPILQAKRRTMLLAAAAVLVASVVSGWLGWRLARRLRRTLAAVMSALRAIRAAQFDVSLSTTEAGELGELQRTIVEMADTLHASRNELEAQVASRTQALQKAVDLLSRADADKRRLIMHSDAVVEEERRRISVDIHDHLGAALISVRLEAAALLAQVDADAQPDMARSLQRIATTAEQLYASTRHIVKSLRPEVIDTLGLAGAVEDLVRQVDKVHPVCRFSFSADADLPHLRNEVAMPAYRVAQEALTNIVKHAGATQASIRLTLNPARSHLLIEIKDNGQGFDAASSRREGMGLIGMRERVAAVGGEITVNSAVGQGCTVRVALPLAGL
jgi:two-component system, NarL family, sensor histidine kinase UhpB